MPFFLSFPLGTCFCLCCGSYVALVRPIPAQPQLCHPERSRRTPRVSAHLNRSFLFNQEFSRMPGALFMIASSSWSGYRAKRDPSCPSPRQETLAVRAGQNKSPQPPSKTAQNPRVNPPHTLQTHKPLAPIGDFSPTNLAYLPPPPHYNRNSPPPAHARRPATGPWPPNCDLTPTAPRRYRKFFGSAILPITTFFTTSYAPFSTASKSHIAT